ncbi:Aminotransferase, class IV, partial [mine drainage metagenome]
LLTTNGAVAEGSGENIFIVKDGVLATPSLGFDILKGITRDSVIKIAESIGIDVEERSVQRGELYNADEIFFTGTAAEITPIVNIDSETIGSGKPGPITKMLLDKFRDVTMGNAIEFIEWLTFVREA